MVADGRVLPVVLQDTKPSVASMGEFTNHRKVENLGGNLKILLFLRSRILESGLIWEKVAFLVPYVRVGWWLSHCAS